MVHKQDKRSDDLASYLHDLGNKIRNRPDKPGTTWMPGGAGTDATKPSKKKPPAGTPGKLYL